MPAGSSRWLAVLGLLVGGAGAALYAYLQAPAEPLALRDMPVVARLVTEIWSDHAAPTGGLPDRFSEPSQGVYVALRSHGDRRYHTWRFQGTVLESLEAALRVARDRMEGSPASIDTVEIVLAHTFRELSLERDRDEILANLHRGVRGLQLRHGERRKIYSPTYLLATNRSPERQIERAIRQWGIRQEQLPQIQVSTFEAEQILVDLRAKPAAATLMERGNIYVPVEGVTRETTRELIDLQIRWMLGNLHRNGRMTYLYWPSPEREAPRSSNNMIRQWMATVALGRIAQESEDAATWELAERNIDYNLSRFYHLEGELGMIEWDRKVKLGALALAAYAIVHHPKRLKWREQEAAIRRTIDELWHRSGRFDSFYKKPPETREQQNFYPGEALFLWAALYEKERDEALLQRFMKSFEYYREWHLEPTNRDPAFIPWHTQAYYQVWNLTRDQRLAEFIFEMNDWLLQIQQWEDVVYRDTQGRFYATGRRYGPPHASSTGVYMEGLVDAWALATALGDDERARAYRAALVKGLRSIRQLQFEDDIDMFYVSRRERVLGGIRTTVYNNSVRCDNVQHSLMANLKIFHRFSPEDYALEN